VYGHVNCAIRHAYGPVVAVVTILMSTASWAQYAPCYGPVQCKGANMAVTCNNEVVCCFGNGMNDDNCDVTCGQRQKCNGLSSVDSAVDSPPSNPSLRALTCFLCSDCSRFLVERLALWATGAFPMEGDNTNGGAHDTTGTALHQKVDTGNWGDDGYNQIGCVSYYWATLAIASNHGGRSQTANVSTIRLELTCLDAFPYVTCCVFSP
jgi:hypothetical protein